MGHGDPGRAEGRGAEELADGFLPEAAGAGGLAEMETERRQAVGHVPGARFLGVCSFEEIGRRPHAAVRPGAR